MSFGENLRSQRVRSGMTQEEVGRALEKSKNNISQYETGKREPDLTSLMRLAELFGVTVDELLGRQTALRRVQVYDRHTLMDRTCPPEIRPVPRGELGDGEYIFYRAGDHSMTSMRIRKGDLLLIRLEREPRNHALGLLVLEGEPCVRMLMLQPNGQVLLISGDLSIPPRMLARGKIEMIGLVERVEFAPASDVR